jgi:hypothetical protein
MLKRKPADPAAKTPAEPSPAAPPSSLYITGSGKPAGPPLDLEKPPEQKPPKPPRDWPYNPDEATMLAWVNTAVNHYIHIRATGSLPAIGGPSWPITNLPATAAGFRQAAQAAEQWWPNARSFDLLGGDLEYKGEDETTLGLAPGMKRLRNAAIITTFAVLDRPPVTPPAPPPAAEPAEATGPEAEGQPTG